MCLLHMSSKELVSRVSKYSYTTGHVGATGCWGYSQIDKSLVVDEEDKKFFEENQTNIDPSGWWGRQVSFEGKYTFDGLPGVLDYSTAFNPVSWYAARCVEALQGKSEVIPYLYGYARTLEEISDKGRSAPPLAIEAINKYGLCDDDGYVKIRGVDADYVAFDDYMNYPTTTGIGIPPSSSLNFLNGSSIRIFQPPLNPFTYLEMCGT